MFFIVQSFEEDIKQKNTNDKVQLKNGCATFSNYLKKQLYLYLCHSAVSIMMNHSGDVNFEELVKFGIVLCKSIRLPGFLAILWKLFQSKVSFVFGTL